MSRPFIISSVDLEHFPELAKSIGKWAVILEDGYFKVFQSKKDAFEYYYAWKTLNGY